MAKHCKDTNAAVNTINEKTWSTGCMFLHLLIISLCMYSVGDIYVHSTHVEVRGQLVRLSPLLPPHGAPELNSSHQAWRQVLLPTESSYQTIKKNF